MADSQTARPLLPYPDEFEAAIVGIVAAVDNVVAGIVVVGTAGADTVVDDDVVVPVAAEFVAAGTAAVVDQNTQSAAPACSQENTKAAGKEQVFEVQAHAAEDVARAARAVRVAKLAEYAGNAGQIQVV